MRTLDSPSFPGSSDGKLEDPVSFALGHEQLLAARADHDSVGKGNPPCHGVAVSSTVQVVHRTIRVFLIRAGRIGEVNSPGRQCRASGRSDLEGAAPSDSVAAGLSSVPSAARCKRACRLASQIRCVPSARASCGRSETPSSPRSTPCRPASPSSRSFRVKNTGFRRDRRPLLRCNRSFAPPRSGLAAAWGGCSSAAGIQAAKGPYLGDHQYKHEQKRPGDESHGSIPRK